MRWNVLVLVAAGGCGLGGSSGGGADNLPTLGAGPYGKLADDALSPAREPYVVTDPAATLGDPAVLSAPDGGYALWYTRTPRNQTKATIWHAEVPRFGELPVDPLEVLAPTQPWEQGDVRAPTIVAGDDGALVMFYQGGGSLAPAVGRADSSDGGHTWTPRPMPLLVDAADPTVLVVDDLWRLYFTRPSAPGIFLATSSDGGVTFVAGLAPVLQRRDTERDAFDRLSVGEPAVVGGISAAGQLRIGLFYVGENAVGEFAVGYAGSDDGLNFVRFFNGNAILDPGGLDEHGPAALLAPAQGALFFSQQETQLPALAAATSP